MQSFTKHSLVCEDLVGTLSLEGGQISAYQKTCWRKGKFQIGPLDWSSLVGTSFSCFLLSLSLSLFLPLFSSFGIPSAACFFFLPVLHVQQIHSLLIAFVKPSNSSNVLLVRNFTFMTLFHSVAKSCSPQWQSHFPHVCNIFNRRNIKSVRILEM